MTSKKDKGKKKTETGNSEIENFFNFFIPNSNLFIHAQFLNKKDFIKFYT